MTDCKKELIVNHRSGRIRGLAATSLLGAACITGLAAADEDFQKAVQERQAEVAEWQQGLTARPTPEEITAVMSEIFGDLSFENASAEEIMPIARELSMAGDAGDRARTRLAELAQAPDRDGAKAAVGVLMMERGEDMEQMAASLKMLIGHPSFGEELRTGDGGMALQYLDYVPEEYLPGMKEEILGLADHLTTDLEPRQRMSAMGYVMALNKMKDIDPAAKKAARAKVVTLFEKSMEEATDDRMKTAFENNLKLLNGPYGRGELIDHAAPAVNFKWNSGDKTYASLKDLKGKVVVLDFWATWCGPCIGSFPQVRELQKRYEGYDVVVVGVTSLQGSHYPGDGPPVDTTDNPEKEYELMAEFMKNKDMTWMVAFTEQDVFNPDFGVRGIPHVAIVDPAGKVRYNGLHPAVEPEKKYEKIDGLLKEANLPAPAPVGKAEEKTG